MLRTVALIVLAATLAGCGKATIEPPPQGFGLTYLRVMTRADPYPEAAYVKLAVENAEFDRRTGQVIDRPETVRVLSATERATFENGLHRERLVGIPPAEPASPACFVPHHFFRYYSATGQQVGEIKVCFCCGAFLATPGLPYGNGRGGPKDQFTINLRETKAFVRGLGLRTDVLCD